MTDLRQVGAKATKVFVFFGFYFLVGVLVFAWWLRDALLKAATKEPWLLVVISISLILLPTTFFGLAAISVRLNKRKNIEA